MEIVERSAGKPRASQEAPEIRLVGDRPESLIDNLDFDFFWSQRGQHGEGERSQQKNSRLPFASDQIPGRRDEPYFHSKIPEVGGEIWN